MIVSIQRSVVFLPSLVKVRKMSRWACRRYYVLITERFSGKVLVFGLLFLGLGIRVLAQSSSFELVVMPYVQYAGSDRVEVAWETSEPSQALLLLARAEYDILTPVLETVATSEEYDRFHRLSVAGLRPDEVYYYQAVSINNKNDTVKGPITSLRVHDPHQGPVHFAVVGDSQGNPEVWGKVAEHMYREAPQFILHAGDLVGYGPNQDEWIEEFFRPAAKLLSHVPLYPAIGNHEMDHPLFYQYYDLPQGRAFYSVKKGPVRMIFVDTNKDILPGSAQYQALDSLLANCQEKWKILVQHHPIFSSDMASYRSSLMAKPTQGDPNTLHLKTLYENYGVDIVFAGHIHGYDRTWPIFKNHIDSKHGVVHVLTAGGGGGLRFQAAAKNWFSAKIRKTHHFLKVNIWENTLSVEAIDTAGHLFDQWELTKPDQVVNPPWYRGGDDYFLDSTIVTLVNPNPVGNMIYRINNGAYQTTTDDSMSIHLHQTTTISCFVTSVNQCRSHEVVKTYRSLPLQQKQIQRIPLTATYQEGVFTKLPVFTSNTEIEVDSISLQQLAHRREDHFAVRFRGSIRVPETAVYRFLLESFDGSRLMIDGQEVIDNDGVHYEIFKEGFIALEKGLHTVEVQYFDYVRRETLNLTIGRQPENMRNINEYIVRE